MSRSNLLFTGIFGSFAISCLALVVVPQVQLAAFVEHENPDEGTRYPVNNSRQGREVYIREGCYFCHSQQVRDLQNGADLDRGWGSRRTVARDYLFDAPPVLGSMRIGPDLTNVGSKEWRNEPIDDTEHRPAKRNREWHFVHLYNPRTLQKNSIMPPFRYLFQEVRKGGERAKDALPMQASREGYVIVPKPDAVHLVDYLTSLDRSAPLPEAGPAKAPNPEKK